jgi:Leucine-rich repeat (LRR) protein
MMNLFAINSTKTAILFSVLIAFGESIGNSSNDNNNKTVTPSTRDCPHLCSCRAQVVSCENLGLTNANLTRLVASMRTDTEYLYLGHNQLTHFSLSVLKPLTSLIDLELQGNKLQRIPENKRGDLKQLKLLNLDFNAIQGLSKEDFRGYGGLHALFISNNHVKEINDEHLNYLVHLRELFVENNNLAKISEHSFRENRDLDYLSLNGNSLFSLKPNLFSRLKRLKEVYLRNNRLATIPTHLFSNNRYIMYIDLSHNRFRELPDYAFSNMTNHGTVDLNLSDNLLFTLSEKVFKGSKDLYISLEGNHFECHCMLLAHINRITRYDYNTIENGYCTSPVALNDRLLTSVKPVDVVDCDRCKLAGCENSVSCTNDAEKSTFRCHCLPGYSGVYCEVKKAGGSTSCKNNTCLTNQLCVPVDEKQYKCTCKDGNNSCVPGKKTTSWTWIAICVCISIVCCAAVIAVVVLRRRKNQPTSLIEDVDDNDL